MLNGQPKRPCVPLTRASWHAGEYRWHSSSTVGPWARHFTSLNLSFLMPQMRTLKLSLPLNEKCKERAYLAETWRIMSALIIITRIMLSLLTHGRKSKKCTNSGTLLSLTNSWPQMSQLTAKLSTRADLSYQHHWNERTSRKSFPPFGIGLQGSTAPLWLPSATNNIYETWSRVLFLGERIQMH